MSKLWQSSGDNTWFSCFIDPEKVQGLSRILGEPGPPHPGAEYASVYIFYIFNTLFLVFEAVPRPPLRLLSGHLRVRRRGRPRLSAPRIPQLDQLEEQEFTSRVWQQQVTCGDWLFCRLSSLLPQECSCVQPLYRGQEFHKTEELTVNSQFPEVSLKLTN